ncbi:unnamed protein product [Dovyalis caffra]|uniref:WIYLD domain-containing protein n=1 Tax=Dovyalis caffra TaxID=77055 RepID=A0AAV1QXN2_9ROSI|nr:unnamed protein product [Dovyalis caffra]
MFQVGLKRIHAALDAVRPLGFPEPLVRRIVRNLLKEYGGDEGWAFIEEGCYKVLIDTLLDEVEKSERENSEPGLSTDNGPKLLIENRPAEDGTKKDEPEIQFHPPTIHSLAAMDVIPCSSVSDAPDEKLGVQVHSPTSHSKQVQSTSMPSPVPLETDALDEKLGMKDPSQQIHSAQASSSHINSSQITDIVPRSLKDVSSHVKFERQSCSPQISSTGVQSPQLFSPLQVDSLPPQRRKPCYGWLSSDDEDEPDLLHLTPAT